MWVIFIKTIIEKHMSEFSYIVFFINIFFTNQTMAELVV